MSAPTKPFANGLGVLLGVVVLWLGALAVLWIGKLLFLGGGGDAGA